MRVRLRMTRLLLSISDLRAIRRRTRIALCPPAVASTGSLNLPVRPRPSPFPVFWGAQGMSPALRYDRCVMVVTVLENKLVRVFHSSMLDFLWEIVYT